MASYQWSFTQQLATPYKIANGHVEVGVAAAPVGNLCEWISYQQFLTYKQYFNRRIQSKE